jgi:hypothetical protein
MAHPHPEPSELRGDGVNLAPVPEPEAQPASDGAGAPAARPVRGGVDAAPIDESPVPPLTNSEDTKGG